MQKEKLGLALGGGGGKGAYQIGVWKYLAEIGLDSYVSVVSGTSVGALNAVLFSDGDIKKAERIWTQQIEDTILAPHKEKDIAVSDGLLGIGNIILDIATNGIFSRSGLKNIIMQEIDFDVLKKKPMPVYATCTRIPDLKGVSFLLNELDKKNIVRALLASSAIPGIFKPEKVLNDFYYDGGIIEKNNVPLEPLNKEGCTQAVVISLSDNIELNSCYNMIVIKPSGDLGDMFEGTLNFSPEKAKDLIRMGYDDAAGIYAEPLHELLCKLEARTEEIQAERVIASFKNKGVKQILSTELNVIPAVLKEEKSGMIKLTACLFDKDSQTMRKLIKIWNVTALDKKLTDMFGTKQMIIMQ